MTKTPVVIALGLLLAATLAVPPTSASYLQPECQQAIKELLNQQAGSAGRQPIGTPLEACAPDVPETPQPCRAPQVGVQGTCLTPPSAKVDLCKGGGYGAKVDAGEYGQAGSCQTLPSYGVCPTGSYGARVGDVGTCQTLPSYGVCPSGSYGVWVGNARTCQTTGTCADRPTPAGVERCGVGTCAAPTYGVVLNGGAFCYEPLELVPEVPETGPGGVGTGIEAADGIAVVCINGDCPGTTCTQTDSECSQGGKKCHGWQTWEVEGDHAGTGSVRFWAECGNDIPVVCKTVNLPHCEDGPEGGKGRFGCFYQILHGSVSDIVGKCIDPVNPNIVFMAIPAGLPYDASQHMIQI